MATKPSYPCLYLFIYQKVKEHARGRRVIQHYELMEAVGRAIQQTPKKYRYIVLKEMEELKLIKRIDKQKVMIVGGNKEALLDKYSFPLLE